MNTQKIYQRNQRKEKQIALRQIANCVPRRISGERNTISIKQFENRLFLYRSCANSGHGWSIQGGIEDLLGNTIRCVFLELFLFCVAVAVGLYSRLSIRRVLRRYIGLLSTITDAGSRNTRRFCILIRRRISDDAMRRVNARCKETGFPATNARERSRESRQIFERF